MEDLSPGQIYDLLSNLVVPRPIAFVSTLSGAGVANLAPFSYFNLGGISPASLVFSTVNKPGGEEKDTLKNIRETNEYVINLLDRSLALGMNETSFGFPPDVEEWSVSGFEAVKSDVVKPARVKQSPASFECQLFEVVSHGGGSGAANYVIGEVVAVHIAEGLVADSSEFRPISRLGGPDYLDLDSMELFELERPSGGN